MKRYLQTICLFTALLSANAQTTQQPSPLAPESTSVVLPRYTVFDADGFPQPARRAFEPGADGTPLPPQNPEAAKYWPPEFKRFLDAAVPLLKRGGKEPSIEEVEKVLSVRFTPILNPYPGYRVLREYQVSNVQFGPPEPLKLGHYLAVLGNAREPMTSWQMTILMDAKNYCVNPYEIAIYFGEPFSEADERVHVERIDGWPPSYTWGMFKRGSQGVHVSRSTWLYTPHQIFNQSYRDPGCISSFIVFGKFIKE